MVYERKKVLKLIAMMKLRTARLGEEAGVKVSGPYGFDEALGCDCSVATCKILLI